MPLHDDPESRAVIYDDVFGKKGLTLDYLVKGIKDSGTKMKMNYYDACLMGMIEIIAGLTECTEYVMSSSHLTPGIGGDYNSLMHHLNNSTNFEEAIKEYCHETVDWEDLCQSPFNFKNQDLYSFNLMWYGSHNWNKSI